MKKAPAPAESGSHPPPVAKKPSQAAPPSKGSKAAASAPGTLDTFKYRHTPEDAETLAADLISPSILVDLGDANWKTRLAALEEMTSWLEETIDTVDAEVVIRALAKKGWSEKNFQVGFSFYRHFQCSPNF